MCIHIRFCNYHNHFPAVNNIIPCGINDKEVTSIEKETNKVIQMILVENKLIKNLCKIFEFELIKK